MSTLNDIVRKANNIIAIHDAFMCGDFDNIYTKRESRDYNNINYIEYISTGYNTIFSTEVYSYSEFVDDSWDEKSGDSYFLYYNHESDLFRHFIKNNCIDYKRKDFNFELTEEWYFQLQLVHDIGTVNFFVLYNVLCNSNIKILLLDFSQYNILCDQLGLVK